MSEIKSLQERIEIKVLNKLNDDLNSPTFMLPKITLGDLHCFIQKTIKEESATAFGENENLFMSMIEGSSIRFQRLRKIMLDRLFPKYLEEEMKSMMEKLEKL